MSRIFFISANTTVEPYPAYPLGMAVVSTALIQAGHEVTQFDFLAAGKSPAALRKALTDCQAEYICFTIRNIDDADSLTNEWYLEHDQQLITVIREQSQAPVICGGPGFSIIAERILNFIGGDYGIVGEGELAVVELIEKLNKGIESPRIIHSSDNPLGPEQQLAATYLPDLVDFYEKASGVMNVQTKRGCPLRCSYCTYPFLEGHLFRPRDPVAVIDDVERLQAEYGANDFFFTDSVFNDAHGHYLRIVEEILRRNMKIRWSSFFTPRNRDLEELPMLKASGLYAVELGTDAASNTTLAGMNKGFTFDDVQSFNESCVENKIPCAHFIIFGGPDETMDTVQEGLDNIRSLESCAVFCFAGIRILPGTPMHKRSIEDGIITEDDDLLKPVYYLSPSVDSERMCARIEDDFRGDRTRVFPPSTGREKLAVMRNFGFNGILWDRLIRFKGN